MAPTHHREECVRRVLHRRLDAVVRHHDENVVRVERGSQLGQPRVDVAIHVQEYRLAVVLALVREISVERVREDIEGLQSQQQ